MDIEQITITTQIITGLSTMLLAIFLLRQLRLQHKDSVTNLRLTIGTQVDDMFRSMYTDRDFANVFLLGCENTGELDKIDQHRFNIFMLQYFAQFKDHWENGNDHRNVERRVNQIFGLGPGVQRFWDEIGINLHERIFIEFVEKARLP